MDKAGVEAAFVAAGLSRLLKDIDYLAQASIRLYTTAVDESTLSIGTSKIGGLPDLPQGIGWPTWKDLPQSLIAQIRLDDVRQYDVDKVLPEHGMLWFFYDAQQETFGADPADRGGWQVFFSQESHATLQRAPAPPKLPTDSQFHVCSLRMASEITLSQQPQMEIPNFDWTKEEQQKYERLLSTFPDSADRALPHNRLLGNPDTIQDDMRVQCQLVSHGVTDENDPRAADLSPEAKNWRLLFQMDSDEHAGMRWANNGLLYYWIEQADLQAHRFDTTWLVLQSE
jgi:uncharacterized protein YwqG